MHLKNTHLYGIHNHSTHVIQDEEKTKWKKNMMNLVNMRKVVLFSFCIFLFLKVRSVTFNVK